MFHVPPVPPVAIARASLVAWDLARSVVQLVLELRKRPDLQHAELLVHLSWRVVHDQLHHFTQPKACPSVNQLTGQVLPVPVAEYTTPLQTEQELATLISSFERKQGQVDLLFIAADKTDRLAN